MDQCLLMAHRDDGECDPPKHYIFLDEDRPGLEMHSRLCDEHYAREAALQEKGHYQLLPDPEMP
jgi:hypothetical protein